MTFSSFTLALASGEARGLLPGRQIVDLGFCALLGFEDEAAALLDEDADFTGRIVEVAEGAGLGGARSDTSRFLAVQSPFGAEVALGGHPATGLLLPGFLLELLQFGQGESLREVAEKYMELFLHLLLQQWILQ